MTAVVSSGTETGDVSRRERLFRLGLAAESHDREHLPQPKLPPPDQQIIHWGEKLKLKISKAFGLLDSEATLPHGARFALLKISSDVASRGLELLEYIRQRPHLNADFMIRLSRDPRPGKAQFVVCVTPRYLSTDKGVKYFVRPDMLESDEHTLASLCEDLEGSDNSLQIWFSTETMPKDVYLKVVDFADTLKEAFPRLGENPAGVTVHAPMEIEHRMPDKLILVREFTVLLRKLLSSNPRAQEEQEIEQIRNKLQKAAQNYEDPTQVVIVIQRTVLSPYTLRMLKQFRTNSEYFGLIAIRAVSGVAQRYPELFTAPHHRRTLEHVRLEDLQKGALMEPARVAPAQNIAGAPPVDGHSTTVAVVMDDKVIVTDPHCAGHADRSGSLSAISEQIDRARREEKERMHSARSIRRRWWNPLTWTARSSGSPKKPPKSQEGSQGKVA